MLKVEDHLFLNTLYLTTEGGKEKREPQDDLETQKAKAVAALGGEYGVTRLV